jgi:hypothetical protein
MKKIPMLLGLVLLVSFSAKADTMPKGLGVHAGLNFADVSVSSTTSTNSTLGYVFGANYSTDFAPDLSFMPGAQIAQRGFGFDIPGPIEVDLKITYLEFPMLFQARFSGAAVTPFFVGGPVVGLKLSTGCSVNGGDCTVYDDSGVKTFHMGLELGGGVIFPLENGSGITAQLRYHLGLTRVADGLADPRHRGLLLDLGYLF